MYARLLAAFLLSLIGYGSLFPFDYVPHQAGWADLHHLFEEWPVRLSASDVAGNVLLFVPLGAVIPSLSKRASGQLAGIVGAIVLAWLLQYLQFWYPSRDPSGSDAVFNTLGLLFGVALALMARNLLARRPLQINRDSSLWPIAGLLMLLWVGYRWFPWVPTLDVANLGRALRPFAQGMSWLDTTRALHDAAAWTLWFWLARHGPSSRLANGHLQASACAVLMPDAGAAFSRQQRLARQCDRARVSDRTAALADRRRRESALGSAGSAGCQRDRVGPRALPIPHRRRARVSVAAVRRHAVRKHGGEHRKLDREMLCVRRTGRAARCGGCALVGCGLGGRRWSCVHRVAADLDSGPHGRDHRSVAGAAARRGIPLGPGVNDGSARLRSVTGFCAWKCTEPLTQQSYSAIQIVGMPQPPSV